jgi:hypothetical protein
MLTHYGTIELRTERLVLRRFAEDDAQYVILKNEYIEKQV